MFNQKVKHRKNEKKISISKVKKRELKKKEEDIFEKVPELIELIIPDCIDEKRDYVVLGDNKYTRSFVISTYPSKTYLGWLDRIFNMLGDVTLSIINRPANDDSVIRQLNKKVTILESERQTYENKGNIDLIHPLEKMIYDYDQIRRQVQTSNDKLFFITILLIFALILHYYINIDYFFNLPNHRILSFYYAFFQLILYKTRKMCYTE